MIDLTGNTALDVFIGLAFFFFVFSVVCSAINEAVATALNMRAKTLEQGIRKFLADPAIANSFYDNSRIQALYKPRLFGWGDKKPSYIEPRIFALTLLDTVAPATGQASSDLISRASGVVNSIGNPTLEKVLRDALDDAGTYRATFQKALERSFNEAMDRVSGWYKRRVQLILFVIALVVVGVLNADSFMLGKRLWQNDAVRTAVVAQASAAMKAGQTAACGKNQGKGDSAVQKAATCVSHVKQLGFPIGWSGLPAIFKGDATAKIEALGSKTLGLLLTAIAVLLGAPFWFDTLSKLAQLRGAGAAPGDKNSAVNTAS